MRKYLCISLVNLVIFLLGSLFVSCQETVPMSIEREMLVSFVIQIDSLSAEDSMEAAPYESSADLAKLALADRLEVRYEMNELGMSDRQTGRIAVSYAKGEFYTRLTSFLATNYQCTSFALWDCGEAGISASRLLFKASQSAGGKGFSISLADKDYDEVALVIPVFRPAFNL